jgi:hypothetical protein
MTEKQSLGIGKGTPGPGRKKGIPNKVNGLLRDDILMALNKAHPEGRIAYLVQQANENPQAFMGLLGRILPTQLEGPGEGGAHIIRFRIGGDA